ncbi:hypothetical protein DFH07DRAFT_1059882 [Mycena maculata]|uniref:Uncharacterized protein n=1 Tax=Mycena maculata TaxID=230809 RepID=A0AAD7NHR8_9AGAR|nr:hypothetical protein DFH07DRAFT_1059882 [Mycena maculata]
MPPFEPLWLDMVLVLTFFLVPEPWVLSDSAASKCLPNTEITLLVLPSNDFRAPAPRSTSLRGSLGQFAHEAFSIELKKACVVVDWNHALSLHLRPQAVARRLGRSADVSGARAAAHAELAADSRQRVLLEVKGRLPRPAELRITMLGNCADFHATATDAPNLRVIFINQNPHLGSLPGTLTVDSMQIQRYAGWNTLALHATVLQRCAGTLRACCLDTASVEPSPVVVLSRAALHTLCVRRVTILQFITAPARNQRPRNVPQSRALRFDPSFDALFHEYAGAPVHLADGRAIAVVASAELDVGAFLNVMEAAGRLSR